jgi:hypothetical protein
MNDGLRQIISELEKKNNELENKLKDLLIEE